MKQNLLSIFALLLVAVSGAWATSNSIVINGTPQIGDESISLTYYFDPANVPGLEPFAPTLKVKCAADNKWDEMWLSLDDVSSGTTNISLENLGEFEAGKTYEVCFAYNNGNWVDEVFQSFVPAAPVTGYTASFTAANAYTIKGGKASVSVDGGIATLDEEGKLPDINEGQQITITAKPGYKFRKVAAEKEAAPEPEVEFVTFTDGTNTVNVATMNLGATTVAESAETSYGNYYAWGATEPFGTVSYTAYNAGTVTATKTGGYSQANAPYYNGSGYTKYTSESDATLEAADDAVAVNMPGWHMPTQAEMQTLFNACGGTGSYMEPSSISSGAAYAKGIYWVEGAETAVTVGSDTYKVNGMLFVQDADTHVFFPSAGLVNGTTLDSAGILGTSWFSSLDTGYTNYAFGLQFFGYNYVFPATNLNRYYGFPVRPFKD